MRTYNIQVKPPAAIFVCTLDTDVATGYGCAELGAFVFALPNLFSYIRWTEHAGRINGLHQATSAVSAGVILLDDRYRLLRREGLSHAEHDRIHVVALVLAGERRPVFAADAALNRRGDL
jgi:hypothetical protein